MRVALGLLRSREGEQRVTDVELFFDLVYVFAVTQLSHYLFGHATFEGFLQTLLLLAVVWLAWAYTMWVTNWFDPERLPVRAMLVGQMLISLVLSIGLPEAFGHRGMLVAGAYVAMQVGRTIFVVLAAPGWELQRNFERVLTWCVASGVLYIAGALVHGHAREVLWLLGIAVDLGGAAVGFFTPGLGRSRTTEWTIEGGHMAERCRLFVIIALGESIVVIGSTVAGLHPVGGSQIAAFVTAFAGSVALWWVYFDRSAGEAARVVAAADDPGRLGTQAFHWIHPLMIAGIIVAASADGRVLEHPGGHASTSTAWLVLGGPALFLAGHAAFKAIVWRIVPWTRLAGVALLGLLVMLAGHVSPLALAIVGVLVVAAVAVTDRIRVAG